MKTVPYCIPTHPTSEHNLTPTVVVGELDEQVYEFNS